MTPIFDPSPRAGLLFYGLILATVLGLTACQPVRPVAGMASARVEQAAPSEVITSTVPAAAATDDAAAVDSPTSAPTPDPALIEAGSAVYHAQYCGVCHALAAAGTTGTFGPPHGGLGATAAARVAAPTYTGTAITPAEYIRESIVAPEVYIVPDYAMTSHRMPPYGHLPDADIDALVEFLLAQ